MFSDPLTLTIGGSATTVPRIAVDSNPPKSTYRVEVSGTTYTVELSSQTTKSGRDRSVARLTREALVADPLLSGQNRPESATVTVTADVAQVHGPGDAQTLYQILLSFLTSANFLRLAGGEI